MYAVFHCGVKNGMFVIKVENSRNHSRMFIVAVITVYYNCYNKCVTYDKNSASCYMKNKIGTFVWYDLQKETGQLVRIGIRRIYGGGVMV